MGNHENSGSVRALLAKYVRSHAIVPTIELIALQRLNDDASTVFVLLPQLLRTVQFSSLLESQSGASVQFANNKRDLLDKPRTSSINENLTSRFER